MAVMNGPYFVETLDEVAKLRKAPSVSKWQEELASKHGLKVVCFDWVQGYRHFFTNKPVRRPDDLKGQRIRTPPAPIWQESVRALGAAPTAMAFGEMYPALQQRRSTAWSWSTTISPAGASTRCSSTPVKRGTSC